MKAINSLKRYAWDFAENTFILSKSYRMKYHGVTRYLVALVLMCFALLVRLEAAPVSEGLQYLTFFPAIALSALIGGFGAGMFAILIGICFATYIFIPPYYTISFYSIQVSFWSNIIFSIDGLVFCAAITVMHRYQDNLRDSINKLSSHKCVEEELKLSALMLNNISDTVFLLNLDGDFVYLNEAAWKSRGYTHDEMMAMNLRDINSPKYNEMIHPRMNELFKSGHAFIESEHLCKDGSTMSVEINARLIDSNGRKLVLSVIRDIRERKKTDLVLRRERDFIKAILDTAGSLIVVLDRQGQIVQFNKSGETITDYRFEEVCGQLFWNIFLQDNERDGVAAAFARLTAGDIVPRYENHWRCKDGSTRLFDWHNTVLLNDEGMVEFVIGMGIDITERKIKEKELIASEARFRLLFDKSFIGISWQDEKRIINANAAFCEMFGYTLEELRSLTIANLTHPDFVAQTQQNVQKVLAGDIRSFTIEKKYVRKNGEVFWGHAIAVDFTGSSSGTRYIMGMVEDISERVMREEQRMSEVIEQRDVLVREVHHRIKNSLQGVAALLRRQAISHPELADLITVAIGRINSIATIHGLQGQTLNENVNIEALLRAIINASSTSAKFKSELQLPVFLTQSEAVPIALVLNELVANACKHCIESSLPEVKLEMCGEDTLITICNYFEGDTKSDRQVDKHGLKLIQSLLPRKFAKLGTLLGENIYTAELKLCSPVTINSERYDENTSRPKPAFQ